MILYITIYLFYIYLCTDFTVFICTIMYTVFYLLYKNKKNEE